MPTSRTQSCLKLHTQIFNSWPQTRNQCCDILHLWHYTSHCTPVLCISSTTPFRPGFCSEKMAVKGPLSSDISHGVRAPCAFSIFSPAHPTLFQTSEAFPFAISQSPEFSHVTIKLRVLAIPSYVATCMLPFGADHVSSQPTCIVLSLLLRLLLSLLLYFSLCFSPSSPFLLYLLLYFHLWLSWKILMVCYLVLCFFVWFSNRDFGPRVFLVGWSVFLAGWNCRWLVGVFLLGWQEFLAGWKDSLTGWLESCPGWMKFLPCWLDSKVWAVWSEVWGARCELWGVRRVVWCVRLLNGSGVAGGHNFLLFEWVRKNAIRFCFVLHIPLV